MKCKVCGAECPSGFKFCPMCASPMREIDKPAEYVEPPVFIIKKNVKPEQTLDKPEAPVESEDKHADDNLYRTVSTESVESFSNDFFDEPTETVKKHSFISRFFSSEDDELDKMFDKAACEDEKDDDGAENLIEPLAEKGNEKIATAEPSYFKADKQFSLFDDEDDSENYDDEDDYDSEEYQCGEVADEEDDIDVMIKKKKRNVTFFAAVGALLILIVILFTIYINKDYDGDVKLFLASVFGISPITEAVKVQKTAMNDGSSAFLVTVYAKKGSTVRFTYNDMVKEIVITDLSASFRLSADLYRPMQPVDGEFYVVYPDIKVIDEKGNIFVPKIPPMNVDVPKLELKLTEPSTSDIITHNGSFEVAGTISDPSALLYAGDTQLPVDTSGIFRGVVSVNTEGKQIVDIEARKMGYSIARITLNVNYEKGDLTVNILNKELRTRDDTLKIEGTMEKGSSIAVSGVDLVGDPVFDSTAGTFNFTVKIPKEKLYTANLTVTSKKTTTNTILYIEHAPDIDSYRESSNKLDYSRIKRYPTHNAHYLIQGKIDMIVQTKPYCIARIQTADGPLMIEYYYTTKIEVNDGIKYTLFGFPNGMYESKDLPIMYVWFVYKNPTT
ncbi:MAG: zinc ribbon domain-containing protein [Clostridia bacterium]